MPLFDEMIDLVFRYQKEGAGMATLAVPIRRSRIVGKKVYDLFKTVYQRVNELESTAKQAGDSITMRIYATLREKLDAEKRSEGNNKVLSAVIYNPGFKQRAAVISNHSLRTEFPQYQTLEDSILEQYAMRTGRGRNRQLYLEFQAMEATGC